MKKLKILLTLLAAILLMVVILSLLSVQRDNRAAEPAMRLLQSEVPRGDGEGSDALWLLPYDIPDAAERRQIMAQLGNHMPADDKLPESLRHRKLISDDEGETLNCISKDQDGNIVAGCLQNVRDHADTYRAAVAQHAKLFANADRVSQYRNLDVRILNVVTDVIPKYQYLAYQTTPAAVDWLDGKSEAAFPRICRNIRTGKTLQQSRGGLISAMIGVAMVRQNKLAADMLAEQPQWAGKLPAHCTDAFTPSADHAENFCRIMQVEYHYMAADIARYPSQLREEMPAWLVPVLFSAEHSKTLASRQLAFACEEPARQAFAQDLPVRTPPEADPSPDPWRKYGSFSCLRNLVGCTLTYTESADFASYARRLQDTHMQQRAFQAALALYRLPEHRRAAELPAILAQHSSPSRQLSYDPENNAIMFSVYGDYPSEEWRIPIALPQRQQGEMAGKLPSLPQ